LTDYDFPDELADYLKTDPQRWREVVLLAGAKAARGTASAAWNLAEALCYKDLPTKAQKNVLEPDCWGALLAAQTLFENEREQLSQVSERNAPKLERIRCWLLAIVENGWLPLVDRTLSGQALSVLGDDREFDELATVPEGPFMMGDDDDEDAHPQHELILPAFKIGRYPVTNAQYGRFVETTKKWWQSGDGRRPEQANCPAVYLTWHDARGYCDWLTDVWRTEGKIDAEEVVRLPTEAEWEKAVRGTDGRIYSWGNDWDETKCNTAQSGIGETCAVGIFPDGGSPFGCLDMIGNVFEWTMSLWGKNFMKPDYKYPYDSADGREKLKAPNDVLRVLRGGSFESGQVFARCAYRFWINPHHRHDGIGFRVVVSLISSSSAL
jgi:iron(II)-dependent oxidoreductase